MRRLILALVSVAAVNTAGAQIIRNPRFQLKQPTAWVSLGAGLQSAFTVTDGENVSRWEFGSATPWAASLEKVLTPGITLGIRGMTAKVPLLYTSLGSSTQADGNVSQGFVTLRASNGGQFHSVLELAAGATMYSNFRSRLDGTVLGPRSPDTDFTFGLGYGFGYSVSPTFTFDVVQDLTTAVHQKTGLSASEDSSTRYGTTRLMIRMGLGGH